MNLNFAYIKNLNPKVKWILTLIFGVGLAIMAISLYSSKTTPPGSIYYGIVIEIDATHSVITAFRWSDVKVNNTAMVEVSESLYVHSGINEKTRQVDSLFSDITPSLNQLVDERIPNNLYTDVHIYTVLGDGYALLNMLSPQLAKRISEQLFHDLYAFTSPGKQFFVAYPEAVSGTREVIYSWATINYILKTLPTERPLKETVGVLRLGDTSSQIAYAVAPADSNDALTLFGTQWTMRVNNNHCYGVNEAVKRYLLLIIKTLSKKGPVYDIPDPCANKNMIRYISGTDFMHNDCIYTIDEPMSKFIQPNATYKFIGNGNMETCRLLVKKLLTLSDCKKTFKYCYTRDPQTIGENEHYFYAIDHYYNVTRVLPTLATHQSMPYNTYSLETTTFCFLDWNDVIAANPGLSPNTCFLLTFIEQSLELIYNVEPPMWENIKFADRIKGNQLEWTLGFMLMVSEHFPDIAPPTRDIGIWTFLILLITGSVLVAYGAMRLFALKQTGTKLPGGEYEIL